MGEGGYINESIVVVLVVITVRRDVAVVDPDVGGFFYSVSPASSYIVGSDTYGQQEHHRYQPEPS